MSQQQHPPEAHEPDPQRWRALGVCLVAGFMTLLDVSIVNVALPSIRTGLDTPESDLQWVLSGYALAFGLFLIPAGLGDARAGGPSSSPDWSCSPSPRPPAEPPRTAPGWSSPASCRASRAD
ncbi:hypothetical protein SDIAM26S_05359 [Streptomyces diastaticus subsp. diastaticus]